jgi:UDP:flavonoid glycosyltransferase YjiC (YdhE family)
MEGCVPGPPGPLHALRDLSDVAVFLNLTDEDYLRRSLEMEQQAVERFKPDVLFSEFKLTAPITSAATGLPLVSTACSPADPRFISSLLSQKRAVNHDDAIAGFNRILEERDLAPVLDVAELFFTRSNVKVAPTIKQIEPLLADVPNLHYVGYLLYDRQELAPLPRGLIEKAHGKNLVFAYFGSGEIGPAQYTNVLPRSFDGTEFHAIVAVGDHPDLQELPDSTNNVTWVRFVPGRSILRVSQALIFHGGQNTAMASLIHKVPSLVFPGTDFERDFNARGLAGIGVGIKCPIEDFTPDRVLEKTRELLSPSYRLAAESYSWAILRGGGARHAADLVLEVAEGKF